MIWQTSKLDDIWSDKTVHDMIRLTIILKSYMSIESRNLKRHGTRQKGHLALEVQYNYTQWDQNKLCAYHFDAIPSQSPKLFKNN